MRTMMEEFTMKLQLLSTEHGLKSSSLKRIAEEMSHRLGYKVFRTLTVRVDRKQLRYGYQVNKLDQYKWFKAKELSALEFTTDPIEAKKWFTKGDIVFGRKTLVGSEGKGIVIFDPKEGNEFKVAGVQVFTKYKKKKREFRVHVFQNKAVKIVEKKLKHDWQGPKNSLVRNTVNGYVFCQEVQLTAALKKRIEELAVKASQVCAKSAFRGVDLGYNESKDDLFVIEVNSAPGIEGSNVQHYCDAIEAIL